MALHEFHWYDRSHPQTLQYGVILLYVNAILLLIFGLLEAPGLNSYKDVVYAGVALAAGLVAGAVGTANDRNWGYVVAVVASVLLVANNAYLTYKVDTTFLLNLVFDIAVVALLLHPQSRDYRRIWFK